MASLSVFLKSSMFAIGLSLSTSTLAQTESPVAPVTQTTATPASMPVEQQSTDTMAAMETMAQTMTRMAEMCEKMMQKEMKGAGLKMVAVGLLFLLLVANLLLLAVLQTLLIKHWHRRLQSPST